MQVQGVASKIVLKISIKTHVYSRKAGPHAGALSRVIYIYIIISMKILIELMSYMLILIYIYISR